MRVEETKIADNKMPMSKNLFLVFIYILLSIHDFLVSTRERDLHRSQKSLSL